MAATMAAPSVIEHQLVFTLQDPGHRWIQVALDCDDAIPGRRTFRRSTSGWALAIPRPELDRIEYRLLVTDESGVTKVICDPENPELTPTVFGERSVGLMPGYRRPAWMLRRDSEDPGAFAELAFKDELIGELPIQVWAPSSLPADQAAPLLVCHDGPEYASLASLPQYGAAMIADGTLPAFRIALMEPLERDAWYAANPGYVAAELAALDAIGEGNPILGSPVVMGASMGGLAALLVALAAQGRIAGVFSQSGSFFTTDLDPQEGSYPYFTEVTQAVARIDQPKPTQRLRIAMTCGSMEENLANNELMARKLRALGHQVEFARLRDLHNYTAWRDGLDPALTDLLRTVWSARR
jgi:enterochelin esterase-like enzyme